jgi:hypothetical protein
MRKRKSKQRADNLAMGFNLGFDAELKKLGEEWTRTICEAFKGSDAVFADLSSIAPSLPSLPPLTFEPWSWS